MPPAGHRHEADCRHHERHRRLRFPCAGGKRTVAQRRGEGMTDKVAIGVGWMELPFADAAGYWRWVDMCEDGAVDSIWQTDRLISKAPILECVATMAALAGRTRRLKFGMNVVSLALREPVLLAKQLATIDFLSDGRLLPGFGIGSPLGPEWEAMRIDTATRGRRTDEALTVIKRLWTEGQVDTAGRFVTLKAASIAPRPVQAELPMWIGGGSEAAIRRTARYGTGWQAGPETPAEVAGIVTAIKAALAEEGRAIDNDHYGAAFPYRFGSLADPGIDALMAAYRKRTGNDPAAYFAIGDADTIVERIAEYIAAGASKFILRPAGRGAEDAMQQTQRLIEEVLPRVAARWPKPAKHLAAAQ
ncbi:MAG: LLM class flavin-dependent oxidoreductase [Proteobacteria bacterium]|nr:LLM class flavin-dependent oxidoreductase [Pseudomonadota bacterium]